MQRYTLLLTANGHTYSFGLDTLGAVFELLAGSGNINAFEVIEWVEGESKTIHKYRQPVTTSI